MNLKNPGHLATKIKFCGTQHFKVHKTVTVPRKLVQTGPLVTTNFDSNDIYRMHFLSTKMSEAYSNYSVEGRCRHCFGGES